MKIVKICLWLAVTFSLGSCDLFRKVQDDDRVYERNDELSEIRGGKVFNPATGEYERVEIIDEPMDTIFWNDAENVAPPIVSENTGKVNNGTLTGETKETYNIAIMMPFLSSRFAPGSGEVPRNSDWGLNFLAGAKLAGEELQSEGTNLSIAVVDTEATEFKTKNLIEQSPSVREADLIVGPYRSQNVSLVADFAKQAGKILVSPYNASSTITEDNPFYIQVNPSLSSHIQAITKDVKTKVPNDQVVLVVRDKPEEINRLAIFRQARLDLDGKADTTNFQEFIITDESNALANLDLSPYLSDTKKTIFVVPSWSNEAFVYNFLRALNVAANTNFAQVEVYGMPQWMDYQRIDYALYEALNVSITSSFFVDDYQDEIRIFKNAYFNRYGTLPNYQAYLGYDTMRYFGRLLREQGTTFINTLDQLDRTLLHTTFDFERVEKQRINGDENLNSFDKFENKYVHILKFKDYYFQRTN